VRDHGGDDVFNAPHERFGPSFFTPGKLDRVNLYTGSESAR
jgi:hypothetical protein